MVHAVVIQVLQTLGLEEIKPPPRSDGLGQGPSILPRKTPQAWETQLRTACLFCHSKCPEESWFSSLLSEGKALLTVTIWAGESFSYSLRTSHPSPERP